MKKKLFIFLLCCLAIFLIYKLTYEEKIDYLALGDGLALGQTYYGTVGYGYTDYIADYLKKEKKLKSYDKNFSKKELSVKELINNINDNEYIIKDGDTLYIDKAIADAEIITLSIGNNEISDINKYVKNLIEGIPKIDTLFLDIEELINLIRKYNNDCEIYLIGFYSYGNDNNDELVEYSNKKFSELCNNNKIKFVKISDLFKDNIKFLPNSMQNYPTNLGYKEIAKRVMNKLIL